MRKETLGFLLVHTIDQKICPEDFPSFPETRLDIGQVELPPSVFSMLSKSSASANSITLPTSAVFRISSFAPAYSIRISALHVSGSQ